MTASHIVTYALSKAGPMTVKQLAAEIGETERNVREYVRFQHNAKKIHVQEWRRASNGFPVAAYACGAGEDAPRPAARCVRKQRELGDYPNIQIKDSYYTRRRHPTVEKLAKIIDTSNPFATAMWNVSQGAR